MAILLAGFMLTGGVVTFDQVQSAVVAEAATQSSGISPVGNVHVGSYSHSDGSRIYCVELGVSINEGGGDNPLGNVGALPAYSGDSYFNADLGVNGLAASAPTTNAAESRQIRYILANWGETANDAQAAAVQIAIWQVRANRANADYQQLLSAYEASLSSNVHGGVLTQAGQMVSQAANWNGASTGDVADPRITIGAHSYTGTVEVDAGTTELTITNGIFSSTGTNTITWSGGANAGTTVQWEGRPPHNADAWDKFYRVTINGKYEYETVGQLRFSSGPGQGTAAIPNHDRGSGNFEAKYIDPDTLWAPELSTAVPSERVNEGEQFSDTVTLHARDDIGSGIWRLSYTSGGEPRYAPIKATGTLYGPFLSDPKLNPSATPPNGAPVAATAEITTDPTRDHSQPQTYEIESDAVSEETGYYSWVWDIDGNDQLDSVQSPPNGESSLPVNYFFTDGFGQASEGQWTPSNVRFNTELSKDEVIIGETFTDDIDVRLQHGGWLQGDDGGRLDFTITGTAYLSDTEPVQQTNAPEDAEVMTTTTVTTNSPDETVTSDPVRIPLTTDADHKYVTMQWCFTQEDQSEAAHDKVVEWCDDYGVPSETAEILRPEVTTRAQSNTPVYGDFNDVAYVDGSMPDLPAEVDFTVYLKPEAGEPKYDENWEVIVDDNGEPVLWAEDEVNDPAAVCEAQPVGKTDAVAVDGTGEFTSPSIRAESSGTAYWVEELFIEDPETGENVSVHRGLCGLPNETTVIEEPSVTTQVHLEEAWPGDTNWDNIIVENLIIPEEADYTYEATVEVFHSADRDADAVCTDENLVLDLDEPVDVTGDGVYESEKYKVKAAWEGRLDHVETLWKVDVEGERELVHVGECGAANESTFVNDEETPKPEPEPENPSLAVTGGLANFPLIAGAALLLLVGAAIGARQYLLRRRATAAVGADALVEDDPKE